MYNINTETYGEKETYYEYYSLNNESSLFGLAKELNLNPDLLAALNGLDPTDIVFQNQILMIPKKGYSYYITKTGDTLESVIQTFNTNLNNLIKNNPTIYLHEGQIIASKVK